MSLKTRLAATTTALGLALAPLGAAPALAQTSQDQTQSGDTAQTQTQQQSSTMASADVSDQKLQAFVDTALEVQTVQQDYRQQAESAANDEELRSIAEEANAEIVAVVESAEGMTMDEYIAISEAAQADQELMDRITAELQERQGGQQQNSQG